MKKSDRIARELEQSVSTGVGNAKEWATPRVEAAVNWAVPRLQQGLDTASPKIQEGLKSAAYNLADGVATVTPRLQDGLAQLAPKISDAAEGATRACTVRSTKRRRSSQTPATGSSSNICRSFRTRSAMPPTPCTAHSRTRRPMWTQLPRGSARRGSSTPSRNRPRPPERTSRLLEKGWQGRQPRTGQAGEAQAPRTAGLRHHRRGRGRRCRRLEGFPAGRGSLENAVSGDAGPVPATTINEVKDSVQRRRRHGRRSDRGGRGHRSGDFG